MGENGTVINDEINRKIGRMVLVTALLLAGWVLIKFYNISHSLYLYVLFFVVIFMLLLDFIRVELNFTIPFLHGQFILRAKEKKGMHGTSLASLGYLVAFAFSDFRIAMAAVAMATYGDSMAAIVGARNGKEVMCENKSRDGMATMFVVSAISGYLIFPDICLITAMAVFATLIEGMTKYLPDDLFICIFTAAFGQIVYSAFSGNVPIPEYNNALYYSMLVIFSTLLVLFLYSSMKYLIKAAKKK